jgi:hypothetical protein
MRCFFDLKSVLTLILFSWILVGTSLPAMAKEWKSGIPWEEPKIVTPGADPSKAPSDAIILFDGKDLSKWKNGENWKVEDGVAIVGKGDISTKQSFGDCQLHIEWAAPNNKTKYPGNSGVFMMDHYEVQILESHINKIYFDGQAGSIYKQSPPLVNACRKPDEWQTFDIIFHAPRFAKDGKLVKPATITVLQNGVLVQDHFAIEGTSAWHVPPKYEAHPAKLPIRLQDHHCPVRFRNIWIRELTPRPKPPIPAKTPTPPATKKQPAAK